MYRMEYFYNFKPSFSDIDLYDCAHHSKYFVWFENARIALMNDEFNLPATFILKYKFPLTDLSCKFYRSILFGEEYLIKVIVECEDNLPMIYFRYRIVGKEKGSIYAKGTTSHVIINNEGKILETIPKELLEKIQQKIFRSKYE